LPATKTANPAVYSSSHGQHVAKYLAVAAEARSLVVGAVTYTWENERRLGAWDGAPPPLRIAQYSHVYGPSSVWSGKFTACDRPCQAVGTYGDAGAAAEADVVVINLMSPRTQWARPAGHPSSPLSINILIATLCHFFLLAYFLCFCRPLAQWPGI
jgi:hypothetical protein